MTSELKKMNEGKPFNFLDPEVSKLKTHASKLCAVFNRIDTNDLEKQNKLIKELFRSTKGDVHIQQPFNCDVGKNISVGRDFLTNYNVKILDVDQVSIGDYCMIGPNTVISTVEHPLTIEGRRKHLSITQPVVIGHDVWIGSNCVILSGVTIGNNVVVGAGAVVTKDIPDNVVVGGIPAKIIKSLP